MKKGATPLQIAAAKSEQKKHSDCFLARRPFLNKMRLSGEQHSTVFEQSSNVGGGTLCGSALLSHSQADKCGVDSLYTPDGGGRLSGANQSSQYTYTVSPSRPPRFTAAFGSYHFCHQTLSPVLTLAAHPFSTP
eukprot:468065-Pleurochrysis_carterae.AAC.1